MEPQIQTSTEIKLIGNKIRMSLANNQTVKLWQGFMPRRKEVTNTSNPKHFYSVEVYDDTTFFQNFSPTNEFEKWAAVPVTNFDTIPAEMDTLTIPAGEYAVFLYKGKSSDGPKFYQYIFGQWLPNSDYQLDDRPHFALMDERYKGEDPNSEEELWIPIRKK